MRGAVAVVLQVAVSFMVVASVLPAVLVYVPAARGGWAGPGLAIGTMVAIFVLLRVLWPRRKRV